MTHPLGDLSPTKAAAIAALSPPRTGDLLMAQLAIAAAYRGDLDHGRRLLACITPDTRLDMLHVFEWAAQTLATFERMEAKG